MKFFDNKTIAYTGITEYMCVYSKITTRQGRKYTGYYGERKIKGIKMRTATMRTPKDAATALDVLHIKNDLEPINVLKKK